jgi:seryl-tRNA synthetase
MLDINFIRDNVEIIKEAARKKRVEVDLDNLLKVDERRRELIQEIETKKAKQNKTTDQIPLEQDLDKKRELIESMKVLKGEIQELEEKIKPILDEWRTLMLKIPNVPDMAVPEGEGEEDNVVIKEWGKKPEFTFEPKDHIELMTSLNMVDFERGTKIHGFRGYVLQNDGALLSWAIWRLAQDFFLGKGFQPFLPPVIVRKQFLYGTGHLPGDGDDIFWTQDDDALAGTAEIPMMAYHADEILSKDELPKKYLAFSPCYRREAGSHSKDTKGLIRVHEFYKLEQLVLCEASHQESVEWHEKLNRNTEEFIERLEIPYRQLEICTGDLKGAHVRSYDTELWIPSQQSYREIASASYYHDFQTRRFNTRYRDESGQLKYVHSLNATAVPTPRILVAIVENNQQADGSVIIPPVLQPYMNKAVIEPKK